MSKYVLWRDLYFDFKTGLSINDLAEAHRLRRSDAEDELRNACLFFDGAAGRKLWRSMRDASRDEIVAISKKLNLWAAKGEYGGE